MRYRNAVLAWVVALGLVAAAVPAAAQEMDGPLTWILSVQVKPGKTGDLKNAAEKYDKPVLDKLVARGVISSWGLACQMIGPPTESCFYYVTAADWAAMGKLDQAFAADRKAMKEAERKAMMDTVMSATEPDKEMSSIVRHVVFHAVPGGDVRYLMRHIYTFKPGKGLEVVKLYKEYIAPTYEKLLSDGVILGYGLAEPEMQSGAGWTHTSWCVFSDMAKLDEVEKAFAGAKKARGDELNGMLDATFMKASVPGAHVDSLAEVLIHGGKTGK
jgi:hypothetical protein